MKGTLSAQYDWDSVYTIEFYAMRTSINGTKGWEVIWYGNSWTDAKNAFEHFVVNRDGQYRLTTPKT